MLVLSRRVYETLRIGENITVTVLGIKGGQVRMGIAAPVEIAIRREDGFGRIKVGTSASAGTTVLERGENDTA